MPILEKKEIGTTEITGGKGTTTPAPPPVHLIAEFLSEHKKLKDYIARQGGRGACVSLAELQKVAGNLTEERINQHLRLFVANRYAISIAENTICGTEAITKMMKMMEALMER